MNYRFSSHFEKIFKKKEFNEKEEIKRAISELVLFFDSGIKSQGLGLKRLRNDIWEIRYSIKGRLLFSLNKKEIIFIIAGNHEDIRRYLKNQ